MTSISELANFVNETPFAKLHPETIENVKIHILDTIEAMLAGSQTIEGLAIGKLLSKLTGECSIPVIGYPTRTALLPAITLSVYDRQGRSDEARDFRKKAADAYFQRAEANFKDKAYDQATTNYKKPWSLTSEISRPISTTATSITPRKITTMP